MQKFCKEPHYLHILRPNNGSDPHFFPVRCLKYVMTEFDDSGVQTQVFKPIPQALLSTIQRYYEQKGNNNNISERAPMEQVCHQNLSQPLMNRQLNALQQKENYKLPEKSTHSLPYNSSQNVTQSSIVNSIKRRKLSDKQAPDFAKQTPQKSTLSARNDHSSLGISRASRSPQFKTRMSHTQSELSAIEDDVSEEMDSLNDDLAEDEESVNTNLMEFLIDAVRERRAIWDSGFSHVDRVKQAEEDWNDILVLLFGKNVGSRFTEILLYMFTIFFRGFPRRL